MNDVFVNSTSCSAFANRALAGHRRRSGASVRAMARWRRRLEEPDATHMRYVVRR